MARICSELYQELASLVCTPRTEVLFLIKLRFCSAVVILDTHVPTSLYARHVLSAVSSLALSGHSLRKILFPP